MPEGSLSAPPEIRPGTTFFKNLETLFTKTILDGFNDGVKGEVEPWNPVKGPRRALNFEKRGESLLMISNFLILENCYRHFLK